ncbi:hypothetical protein J6590_092678 [Homalodisca vitripennis]|nr:hypothetical protein J6590_092678 [Homalodisca vitripennis]
MAMGNNRRLLCVFVPGFKGSALGCEQCKRRSWPPGFLDHTGETFRRCIEVSLVGGLYVREVYSVFLRDLQKECNAAGSTDDGLNERVTLEKFAYDWTRGVHYAAEKLYVYLSTMSRGYHAIALIVHSMGGLVCRYLLEVLVYAKRAYDETARHLYRSVKR